MVTYGTTSIPSDTIEVIAGGTVAVSAAFDSSVALVGGMDASNGSATEGNLVEVQSPSDAQSKFGDGSELHEQVKLAYANGVSEVHALPVSESSVSSETQSTATGSLDNAPIFDPNVNTEHSVTVADSGGTDPDVEIVYEEGSNLNQPSTSDTIRINPVTGEYAADATPSGSNYEFTYDYGDYAQTVLDTAADDSDARIVGVLTENETVLTDLATVLGNNAGNQWVFQHGVGGAQPDLGGSTASNYSDSLDDRRLSVAYPSRWYTDEADSTEVRTVGAVAGYLADLPLGQSSTNDELSGLVGTPTHVHANYDFSDAGDLIDNQVMPLWNYPPATIIKDMTTSTTQKFERVYSNEIVDEVAELSHLISREYVGDQNTSATRNQLSRSHRNMLLGLEDETPPLLEDFTVSVKEDPNNANEVDVELGIDVVGVMDTIDVTVTVGDIIRNGGAA